MEAGVLMPKPGWHGWWTEVWALSRGPTMALPPENGCRKQF